MLSTDHVYSAINDRAWSRLGGSGLWDVNTLQTVRWEIGAKSRSRNNISFKLVPISSRPQLYALISAKSIHWWNCQRDAVQSTRRRVAAARARVTTLRSLRSRRGVVGVATPCDWQCERDWRPPTRHRWATFSFYAVVEYIIYRLFSLAACAKLYSVKICHRQSQTTG